MLAGPSRRRDGRMGAKAMHRARLIFFAGVLTLSVFDRAADAAGRVATPWPRVLPCAAFAAVTFEVFGPGGTLPSGPREVVWTGDGQAMTFVATRSGPAQVADPIALTPSFASRALSVLALPDDTLAEGPQVNIWLACAGADGAGIEWVCKGGPSAASTCTLGVVYGSSSAPRWPEALASEGALGNRIERLLTGEGGGALGPGPRAALPSILRELALATRSWLNVACASGRCPQHIVDAGVRLTRFTQASAPRIARADRREVLDNEHYRAGYPRLEVEAEAGGETMSLTWERPEDWRLSFGERGPGRVTCAWDGCAADEVSVGSTLGFHFYHRDGFGVRGPPLAVRAH